MMFEILIWGIRENNGSSVTCLGKRRFCKSIISGSFVLITLMCLRPPVPVEGEACRLHINPLGKGRQFRVWAAWYLWKLFNRQFHFNKRFILKHPCNTYIEDIYIYRYNHIIYTYNAIQTRTLLPSELAISRCGFQAARDHLHLLPSFTGSLAMSGGTYLRSQPRVIHRVGGCKI